MESKQPSSGWKQLVWQTSWWLILMSCFLCKQAWVLCVVGGRHTLLCQLRVWSEITQMRLTSRTAIRSLIEKHCCHEPISHLMIYTRETCEEAATCSHALFAPSSPPSTPTSQSMMKSLCHYCNNAINEVSNAVTTPVWCTLRDILGKSASFIYPFFFSFFWLREKINK